MRLELSMSFIEKYSRNLYAMFAFCRVVEGNFGQKTVKGGGKLNLN